MLIQQFSRNEWEEVKLVFLKLILFLLFLQSVIEHFLVVEEQEFILENL